MIRIHYLMDLLARAGFHTWSTANGRVGWQIGELTSDANDPIDALTMALHWLTGEIRDLQSKLDHLQENPTMPVQTSRPAQQEREQDLAIRLQHAEQRRASDQALRQALPRYPTIADDAAMQLNTLLDKTAATAKASYQTGVNGSGPTLINYLDIILHTPRPKKRRKTVDESVDDERKISDQAAADVQVPAKQSTWSNVPDTTTIGSNHKHKNTCGGTRSRTL